MYYPLNSVLLGYLKSSHGQQLLDTPFGSCREASKPWSRLFSVAKLPVSLYEKYAAKDSVDL